MSVPATQAMQSRFWLAALIVSALSVGWHVSPVASQAVTVPGSLDTTPSAKRLGTIDDADIPAPLRGDYEPGDIAAATAWAEQLHLADWLGPLAPLALSPFFGVACLSGLALWGPEWVTDNALLGSAGPLRSIPLLVTFVVLTLVTSLPRLTKVSKPFAQAVDRLEAYAVIVILLVIKVIATTTESSTDAEPVEIAMVQLGIFSFTANTLLMVAMTLNILVINSVKFFFEFLVWLTPFPAVDAAFELANKSAVAALMTVYAFSPTIATLLNCLILLAALIVFRWVHRRVRYFRSILLDPVLARFWTGYGCVPAEGFVVFPEDRLGSYPAKSQLRLVRDDQGMRLVPASPWSSLNWGNGRAGVRLVPQRPIQLRRGFLMHTLVVCPDCDGETEFSTCELTMSRRHDTHLTSLAQQYALVTSPDESSDGEGHLSGLRTAPVH